jgi:hypothetical protein
VKAARRFFLVTVCLAVMFESTNYQRDPWSTLGWYFQTDISGWAHVHVIVTLLELCIGLCLLFWLRRGSKAARRFRFQGGTLAIPLTVFAAMLALGVLNGALQRGNLTVALWEVRGFAMAIAVYVLAGMYLHNETHANQLVWALLLGSTVLAVDNSLRAIVLLRGTGTNDLAYDHVDSVVVSFAMLLCLALLAYGGTRAQRRYAVMALPVLMFCLLVMKRRAAFPVLAIGIVVFVIFLLRLRPRLFWKFVPPVVVLSLIYLGIFWNNTTSVWGQPARAISSLVNPDPRDLASNLYRTLEKSDIVANIMQSPLTGIGFGKPYVFYVPLPNLSFWPFWHYETHNAVLWLWMTDGVLGFMAFWWLLGRAAYDGSKVVETQREEWALVRYLRSRLNRRGRGAAPATTTPAGQYARVMLRPLANPEDRPRRRPGGVPTHGLNVPQWERSAEKRSRTARPNATLALLVASICLIPMQITYSYVDLGLVSERDMLLFGLALGVIARGLPLLGTQMQPLQKSSVRLRRVTAAPTPAPDAEAAALLEALVAAPARTPSRSRPVRTRPLTETPARPAIPSGPRRRTAGPARRRSLAPAPATTLAAEPPDAKPPDGEESQP